MTTYLMRFSYTPETWKRLIQNPEDRRVAARAYAEQVGEQVAEGRLHHHERLTRCRSGRGHVLHGGAHVFISVGRSSRFRHEPSRRSSAPRSVASAISLAAPMQSRRCWTVLVRCVFLSAASMTRSSTSPDARSSSRRIPLGATRWTSRRVPRRSTNARTSATPARRPSS
jgi:hypothetical protein